MFMSSHVIMCLVRVISSMFLVSYHVIHSCNHRVIVVLKFSMNPADPFYSMKLRFVNGREILTRREFQVGLHVMWCCIVLGVRDVHVM